ncbi:MAG TPA: tetratricopeptide repeat protein, partial [Planctomycetes bacterium]|nr:tetratricopeptide repeat protein [Planctomycetota bacterium]
MKRLTAALMVFIAGALSAAEKPTCYQNTPVFPVTVTRVNSSDIADILLEYYDGVSGRWMGCGLFSIARTPYGEIRARGEFTAPAEGAYRLRSVARDPAGNVEPASDDPGDYHIMAVYDATPPAVQMVFPRGGERIEAPGAVDVRWIAHDVNIATTSAARMLWSRDGGLSFETVMPWSDLTEKYTWHVPDVSTETAVVAVEIKDVAGNTGRAQSGLFAIKGSRPAPRPDEGKAPAGVTQIPVMQEKIDWTPPEKMTTATPPAARSLARRYYTRGVIYLVRGDYDEAVNELTSALQADPDFVAARVDLGVALVQMGRMREGLDFLENSYSSFPGEYAFPYNAGLVYHNAGDYEMALRRFRQVLSVKPEHTEALWMAADCAIRLNDTGAAVRYWLAIIETTRPGNRYHDDARRYLGKLGIDISSLRPSVHGGMPFELPPVRVRDKETSAEPAARAVEEARGRPVPSP